MVEANLFDIFVEFLFFVSIFSLLFSSFNGFVLRKTTVTRLLPDSLCS